MNTKIFDQQSGVVTEINESGPALSADILKQFEACLLYTSLPLYTNEIADELNKELTQEWVELRGISVVSVALASITPDAESAKKISEFQESRVYTNCLLYTSFIAKMLLNHADALQRILGRLGVLLVESDFHALDAAVFQRLHSVDAVSYTHLFGKAVVFFPQLGHQAGRRFSLCLPGKFHGEMCIRDRMLFFRSSINSVFSGARPYFPSSV